MSVLGTYVPYFGGNSLPYNIQDGTSTTGTAVKSPGGDYIFSGYNTGGTKTISVYMIDGGGNDSLLLSWSADEAKKITLPRDANIRVDLSATGPVVWVYNAAGA